MQVQDSGCGKIGHIKPACLNKSRQQQPKTAGNVRHVQEETQEEDYASQEEDKKKPMHCSTHPLQENPSLTS